MWLKFKASSIKEFLLLIRDRAGLAMLFIMPMLLIFIMSMLQESTLKKLEERQTPVLIVNYDQDTLGIHIVKGLKSAGFFEVHELVNGVKPNLQQLKEQVNYGKFRVGIIIKDGASDALRNKIKNEIQEMFPEDEGPLFETVPDSNMKLPGIDIYFDPITQPTFKHAVSSALKEFIYAVEAKMIMGIYAGMLYDIVGIEINRSGNFKDMIDLNEQYVGDQEKVIIPNAVQHNVPAWTIFAMFFIVIPLAGNIIKERESGMTLRLRTMPGSNLAVIFGKANIYFIVGILQAILMLLIGVYILPLFGMPSLKLGSSLTALLLVTISISLAASGYGILIGTIATSQEQSSIFGSISVVILAAIGGIWIPTFMMSETMNTISKLSPLNWGLDAYYDIFLRNAGISETLGYIFPLLLFALICMIASWLYNRFKSAN